MPAYSFQKQFVPLVANGSKLHTVRAPRKRQRPPQVGETIYLYYGMRTKQCEKIGESCITRVQDFRIDTIGRSGPYFIFVDGEVLTTTERDRFAEADGFSNWDWMLKFWEGRLPFTGYIIYWKPLNRYVHYSKADKCWCQPFEGKGHRHPKCPMHKPAKPVRK